MSRLRHRAVTVGVRPNKLIPRVLHEWREPRHEAFQPRDVWSHFNAFTEALKGNLNELPHRSGNCQNSDQRRGSGALTQRSSVTPCETISQCALYSFDEARLIRRPSSLSSRHSP